MITRPLGKTGASLSVIGFGGILLTDTTPAEAAQRVGTAVDRGINYFDVAPTYGNAEERLGPALEPYRNRVFLACKTTERLAGPAAAELEISLKRLKTDHVDLYQFHGVTKPDEVDRILGPGGALEAFIKARDKGLIRHIGFSAHTEEAALRLLEAFAFDSVLFPINLACWTQGHFGPRVAATAQALGIGLLALKALAKRPLREGEVKTWTKCWYAPYDTAAEVKAALAFTLSKPVTAALTPGHPELFRLACDAVEAWGAGLDETPATIGIESAPLFRIS
jgi:aryl-alcohol dehydrogenase-like predicted oxidoreductase